MQQIYKSKIGMPVILLLCIVCNIAVSHTGRLELEQSRRNSKEIGLMMERILSSASNPFLVQIA